jgi:very-short-patch-repair endonuclease
MREDERKARAFAKSLRRSLTRTETILWTRLKAQALQGHKFRRQHPIGPYIADFACVEARLVLEVDGDTHGFEAQIAHDARRDAYLRARGWQVVRVTNMHVYSNLNGVLDMIADIVLRKVPPPSRDARHLPRKRGRRTVP